MNSPIGTTFFKSIDGFNFVKMGEKLFKFLTVNVEEVGEEKVIQIVTCH